MALPNQSFLRKSVKTWRGRLAYRQARLKYWRRRGSPDYVDKWQGLVDEARYWIRHRKGQLRKQGQQASEHFRISEFDCHDGTRVPEVAYDALRDLCEDVLEPMRREFGACGVTSGYRHRAYNASIGGATLSQHIYDLTPQSVAADVTFAKGSPAEWAEFARGLNVGGVGQYNRSGFVHVDNGPRRDWWG